MITLLLADDHETIRDSLAFSIEHRLKGCKIVAQAGTGREAVKLAQQHKPKICIVDMMMPDLNGMEATAQILKDVPETKVIALSSMDDRHTVEACLKAGASAYVLKESAFKDLAEAIKVVLQGKSYLSPAITDIALSAVRRDEDTSPLAQLTSREMEVLQLLAEGKETKEISSTLHIASQTVHTHKTTMMIKLKLTNQTELVKFAIREGVVEL